MNTKNKLRDSWGSRLGIIMAVAGAAVGLGNFLRFPVQAVKNGGGAFIVPYFLALLFVGIPLMWIEWSIGRYGGGFGLSTAPGMFQSLWRKNRFIKYFGIIGIFGPLVIMVYYTYIESWTLAYSFFAITGKYSAITNELGLRSFLNGFQGLEKNEYFSSIVPAYIFFIITFAINIAILKNGIKGGIERFCKYAMPTLFIFAFILAVKVLSSNPPNILHPDWNVLNGLGYLWNPDFSQLKNAKIWLSATGQILFTLSVGMGVILTYASYLKKSDDVVLSGLTASSLNEIAEVILGGCIVIPVAFMFFGPTAMGSIANSGAFNLGFVTMPQIFNNMAWGELMGFLWFSLLFLAGVTSSVSMAQPAIAFMEDEFNISRKKSIFIFSILNFILSTLTILFFGKGVVDELDFWGGTFCLILFAIVEVMLFAWIFGIDKAWEEMHHGSDMKIPPYYKFIIKYITPAFLLFVITYWFFQEWIPILRMDNVLAENKNYVIATRGGLCLLFFIIAIFVKIAWEKRKISELNPIEKET
ncbi:sodium:neurotransmitter symporter family protein [Candidatus Omnitrophus magneticus]|uniref:Sodium:neurotransmitter symporter family protein n=1 Tax=Candidatus Omnitrophus magneticus TaxID=1609969 RepID=A0A0F0CQ10_9BACT|nr:sodium:neurotransmitter symporter family protein [Candidatus Omnitrophus magneticus]